MVTKVHYRRWECTLPGSLFLFKALRRRSRFHIDTCTNDYCLLSMTKHMPCWELKRAWLKDKAWAFPVLITQAALPWHNQLTWQYRMIKCSGFILVWYAPETFLCATKMTIQLERVLDHSFIQGIGGSQGQWKRGQILYLQALSSMWKSQYLPKIHNTNYKIYTWLEIKATRLWGVLEKVAYDYDYQ